MRSSRLAWLILLVAPLAVACGDDDAPRADAAAVTSDGAAATDADPSATDADPSATDGDPSATDADPNAPDADPSAPDAGKGAPDGSTTTEICGSILGGTCKPSEYCDYPDDICGAADNPGTCQPRPDFCTDDSAPVCGCDGLVHSNACEAFAAGTDVALFGGCDLPADSFFCGHRICKLDGEYCRRITSDVLGFPDSFSCEPDPAGCMPADCACMDDEPCGELCAKGEDGGITLTCPGG